MFVSIHIVLQKRSKVTLRESNCCTKLIRSYKGKFKATGYSMIACLRQFVQARLNIISKYVWCDSKKGCSKEQISMTKMAKQRTNHNVTVAGTRLSRNIDSSNDKIFSIYQGLLEQSSIVKRQPELCRGYQDYDGGSGVLRAR